jgi:thiosulfate/3-mercaptopyruvate sulfurtransferase
MTQELVSTIWLAEHLASPDISIIDCSWHMPAAKRDAKAEFFAARIPGAQFFDIDLISDTESTCPICCPSRKSLPVMSAKWASATARR